MERQRGTGTERRPQQAALCHGRRCCAASTAAGRGETSCRGVPCARTLEQGGQQAAGWARSCAFAGQASARSRAGRERRGTGAGRAGPGGGARGAVGAGWARPGRGLVRAEPLQGGACAGGLGEARARGARWRAERGRGGVPGWRARPGEQGARGGRGPGVRGREERKGREGERKWEKEKKKKKKKKGGKKREKGERERGIRAGITAPIAEPVGHAWRPGARECDARVEVKQGAGYGCRVFGGSGDLAEQGRFRKLGLGFQGGISSSTTKQNFSA